MLSEKVANQNESIRFRNEKIVKILKEQTPEENTILKIGQNDLQINLAYGVKTHKLNISFNVSQCDVKDTGMFTAGLMKHTIELFLLMDKMRKALEAKDQEIEEYKHNGAVLIRGKLKISYQKLVIFLYNSLYFRIAGY